MPQFTKEEVQKILSNGAVGIDLGTTYSAVAAISEAGRPEILTNAEGATTTPSVVLFDQDGTTIVGEQAKAVGPSQPGRYMECVKRCMGSDTKYEIDGKTFSPEGISAVILGKLIKDASERLGKPIASAVITVPAWFNDEARQATQNAGKAAGLLVLGILSEPTAAALAYGIVDKQRDKTILVYDLGGGTFDVSLIRIDGTGNIKEFAREGDVFLGGKDWDQTIVDRVCQAYQSDNNEELPPTSEAYATLVNEAEKTKKRLSESAKAKIFITHEGKKATLTVTKEELDSWTSDLLARTEATVNKVLGEAKLTPEQIDVCLPVGGSTRMPHVKALLDKLFPNKVDNSVEKDHVVAIGACLYMAKKVQELKRIAPDVTPPQDGTGVSYLPQSTQQALNNTRIVQVSSRTYGIAVLKPDESGQYVDPFVKHNQELPLAVEKTYATVTNNAPDALIELYEGDDTDPAKCKALDKQSCPLPPGQPRGTPLKLQFNFTAEGMIRIVMLSPGKGELNYQGAIMGKEEQQNISSALGAMS